MSGQFRAASGTASTGTCTNLCCCMAALSFCVLQANDPCTDSCCGTAGCCLCVLQADDPDAVPVLDILGIEVLPTVQFWREGKLLWEHRGVNQLEQNMGEGVLYFGDRWGRTVAGSGFGSVAGDCCSCSGHRQRLDRHISTCAWPREVLSS